MGDTEDEFGQVFRACDAFRQQVGKMGTLRARPANIEAPYPTVAFRPKGGKADRIYIALPIPVVNATAITLLIRDWKREPNKLVVADYVPDRQALRLKEAGIPFIDAAGNAYLVEPGFFLFIAGCPLPLGQEITAPIRQPRLFNPTGLKVLFLLITRPDYLNRPYRDIAKAANVALGTVVWIMGDLKQNDYLIDLGTGNNRLKQREKLIDEWTAAYANKLVPRHKTRRFKAETADWWKKTDLRQFNAFWGGDVAADRLTGHLKPGDITIYAHGLPRPLLEAKRMRADPQGDVKIIEAFWNFPPTETEKDTVPPLLVYADLLATGDPRAIEVAKLIQERYLGEPNRTN
jgi:hypothetical protein